MTVGPAGFATGLGVGAGPGRAAAWQAASDTVASAPAASLRRSRRDGERRDVGIPVPVKTARRADGTGVDADHCATAYDTPMTSFAEEVYDVVRSVPPGRVTTYGTIAHLLGRVRGARQVGWAMRNCPDDVPAHRVVGAGGYLSGGWAFGHPSVQRALLEDEGVRFVGEERCDIRSHLWAGDDAEL